MKRSFFFLSFLCLFACSNSRNSPDFIKKVTGKYLFNSNESIEIYFLDNELKVKWRGNDNISPLKVNDSTFYVQEMNEKIVFVLKPKTHIVLAEKREHKGKKYLFEKLPEGQKTPLEYLLNNEFKNALAGYLAIQQKDSLDKTISQRTLISYGFEAMNEKKMDLAINIFKINTVLYPTQSNGFNRLGSAYWRVKDTSNTVKAYKKALSINPENSEASGFLKKHKFE